MEMSSISSNPRSVEDIYKDYNSRRTGIVRALTTDVDEFYSLCDPEKENLCLYGHPNDNWEVTLPAEEVPPELPEPALGINFARDGMKRQDWLSLVAVHSDSVVDVSCVLLWGSIEQEREAIVVCKQSIGMFTSVHTHMKRLFSLINDLPTVYEVVSEKKDKAAMGGGSKSMLGKHSRDGQVKSNSKPVDERYVDDEDEHSETLWGTCGGNYNGDEFWIGCDICERWFHGKCVKITPAKAESIKQYKCPNCSSKKSRQ